MKILEVINALKYRGGAEVFVASLCEQMSSIEGVDVTVVALFEKVDISFKKMFSEYGIPLLTCKKNKGMDWSASKMLKSIVKEYKPDIIHLHLSCLPTYYMAFGTKKYSWELVETFHTIPGQKIGFLQSLLRKVFIRKKRLSFVGISDSISKQAKSLYKNIKCDTISNGVALCDCPRHNHLYNFIIVASMTEVKNHMLLFEALKEVKKVFADVSLLCCGGGSLLPEYKQYIADNDLISNVTFTGQVYNVEDYLIKADCFVLSSIREGNPISILEAMSCGLPVIAPSVGGIPDIVKDGRNGFLYTANDKAKLIELLLFSLNNKQLMNNIGDNNFRDVKKYSINNTADQYINLFNSILKTK